MSVEAAGDSLAAVCSRCRGRWTTGECPGCGCIAVTRRTLYERERAALGSFCLALPPITMVSDPAKADCLQQWVREHLKPRFAYATVISILDAASAIAHSQIDNGGERIVQTKLDHIPMGPRPKRADFRLGSICDHGILTDERCFQCRTKPRR